VFQIFVVVEKMRRLIAQDLRQVQIGRNVVIERVQIIHGNRDNFLVQSRLIFHQERAHGTAAYNRA
jgi:hypothetical protein